MGKIKDAAIDKPRAAKPATAKGLVPPSSPSRLTYALAAYTAEMRREGWYIGRSVPSFTGEQTKWIGPFETIETACLSIARHLATELADRHTRSIESHKLKPHDPLYGLKPTTKLSAAKTGSVA